MTAFQRLEKRVRDLEDEFHEFKASVGQELLDRSDPNNYISRLDRLESQQSRGFWRRLLHLKPAKHKNILRIGGNGEA